MWYVYVWTVLDISNCVFVKQWTLVGLCEWACNSHICTHVHVTSRHTHVWKPLMSMGLLWSCLHVQMLLFIYPCVRNKLHDDHFQLDLCSCGSAPADAKWEGRARETASQSRASSLGERCVQRACSGPDGTSKHSSFATAILFSHHFNFKEASGCISICLG